MVSSEGAVEYFDVVNEQNEVIGRASRQECHSKGLLHRSIHILVVTSKGKIAIQKRSMNMDLYKGYYSNGVIGHVMAGETYENAAMRELKEELDIDSPISFLFDAKKISGNDHELMRFFLCRHDGKISVNPDEVASVVFLSLDEVFEMLKTHKFTPCTDILYNYLRKNPSLLN